MVATSPKHTAMWQPSPSAVRTAMVATFFCKSDHIATLMLEGHKAANSERYVTVWAPVVSSVDATSDRSHESCTVFGITSAAHVGRIFLIQKCESHLTHHIPLTWRHAVFIRLSQSKYN
ncbi:hypothetical protein EVAR_23368_1 [Eumeta japonica]|uniref:Uncharacterized protein n=1 Tax=Eumeta variegata TaxID=151549 RepID=A0A4C1VW06_EUMVA|nr:hypothetical protein EVAR_23368_1 [Eumeta japonica]